MNIKLAWITFQYRFIHWMFQWKQDSDKDIAFVLFGFLVFIKYKEHTLVKFNGWSNEYTVLEKYR